MRLTADINGTLPNSDAVDLYASVETPTPPAPTPAAPPPTPTAVAASGASSAGVIYDFMFLISVLFHICIL
jgi:hypothetical protein